MKDSRSTDTLRTPSARRLGEKVRYWRLEHQMSKADFCNYVGISRPLLDAIEAGRSNIVLHRLVRIADALGVEPWELIR